MPYGTDDRQKLDVYLPKTSGLTGLPVLMFLHGGYWMLGHKDTLGFMAPPITQAPAILVTAGYRLAPGAKYPEQVDDCRNALKWVYENISDYGGRSRSHIRRWTLGWGPPGVAHFPAAGPVV